MKSLLTLRESDIVSGVEAIDTSDFERRYAVRAVITNEAGHLILLHVSKLGYHKLPGGGFEVDEDR